MPRSAVLALGVFCLPVATIAAPPPTPMVQKVKSIIAQRMVDPDSLQVRSAQLVTAQVNGQSRKVLCGEYNAKNRLGGYVGFKGFAYEPDEMSGVLTFDSSLAIAFFDESGGPDFDSESRSAVANGLSLEAATAQSRRVFGFARTYVPICLGLS